MAHGQTCRQSFSPILAVRVCTTLACWSGSLARRWSKNEGCSVQTARISLAATPTPKIANWPFLLAQPNILASHLILLFLLLLFFFSSPYTHPRACPALRCCTSPAQPSPTPPSSLPAQGIPTILPLPSPLPETPREALKQSPGRLFFL